MTERQGDQHSRYEQYGPNEQLRRAKSHLLVADIECPSLTDDDLHHLTKVLRCRDGDVVSVTDGHGAWQVGRLEHKQFVATDDVHHEVRGTPPVRIGVAIPKNDRPEWIVQKCTEIGVAEIIFIETERSVVKWGGARSEKKLDRLRRGAREALRQSRGVWMPSIEGPIPAALLLPSAAIAEPGGGAFGDIDPAIHTFLIGPEGGWSDAERDGAAAKFGLGGNILRIETAAILVAAAAIKTIAL